eukprot:CAMPEP_0173210924 /NCGR_PEP_ID=MMETSP1141-20130122/23942_1 /TAXON_ID=483371 /ORGANISM="non described non described, Strain CCMP2298" /LENGTH=104 /DNA_ID=CAMNT_0014137741 /DNA_START=213 /DNA_END=527 /DNA_ORIENTATION=+
MTFAGAQSSSSDLLEGLVGGVGAEDVHGHAHEGLPLDSVQLDLEQRQAQQGLVDARDNACVSAVGMHFLHDAHRVQQLQFAPLLGKHLPAAYAVSKSVNAVLLQ